MERFEPDKVDDLLGLPKRGLTAVALLALGYRDEQNDWLLKLKKVRTLREEFVTIVNDRQPGIL